MQAVRKTMLSQPRHARRNAASKPQASRTAQNAQNEGVVPRAITTSRAPAHQLALQLGALVGLG